MDLTPQNNYTMTISLTDEQVKDLVFCLTREIIALSEAGPDADERRAELVNLRTYILSRQKRVKP